MEPEYKEVQEPTGKGYELCTNEYGTKYWYLNDQLHHEDGPAIEYLNGNNRWYLNDTFVTEQEFNEVWKCPMDRLPLYINTVFAPIAKRRLLGEVLKNPGFFVKFRKLFKRIIYILSIMVKNGI